LKGELAMQDCQIGKAGLVPIAIASAWQLVARRHLPSMDGR
jgi:hypothetical protein